MELCRFRQPSQQSLTYVFGMAQCDVAGPMPMETFVEIGAKSCKRCPLIGMTARALRKHYELFKPISQQQRPTERTEGKNQSMEPRWTHFTNSEITATLRKLRARCSLIAENRPICLAFPATSPRTGRGFLPVRNCRKSPPMNALEA